jgi:CheY-like chemotaxis protein
MLMTSAGFNVIEAASGAQAIEYVDAHPGSIDLLLTDVVMPQMTGVELASHLLEKEPRLRVLFMSGYADSRGLRQGNGKREQLVIQKPFSAEQLLDAIRTVLAKKARK